MSIYPASSEEVLTARKLLVEWTREGFLSPAQRDHLQQQTASDLRTTNIFLRAVLFFFTVLAVGAAILLVLQIFLTPAPTERSIGIVSLVFAAAGYIAAEATASRGRLYRYGIEEALAVCSIAFLYFGLRSIVSHPNATTPRAVFCLIAAACAGFSLWIWHRFGLWYAFAIAMLFAIVLADTLAATSTAQHALVCLLYAGALIIVIAVRTRHRLDLPDHARSLVEALLWLGIYLSVNLQLSSLDLRMQWWIGTAQTAHAFPRPFYWTTWVLIWCLPLVVLVRGIRRRDRTVLATGAILAVLTLITNKPYLGWPRHTWDPMLLGLLLSGTAWWVQRWLAGGPHGVRHGFTAARISGKDKDWLSAGSALLGLLTPHAVTPEPPADSPVFEPGGGHSGGGGASGDF